MDANSMYDIWRIERSLWLEGAETRDCYISEDAICIMPTPFGIMPGREEFDRVHRISPYSEVEFHDRAFNQTRHCIVIAYRADAVHRTTYEPYSAYCSTTYVWESGELRIIAHQHSAVGDPAA